eukprot:8729730-Pyramimonas_sp.AAC.1
MTVDHGREASLASVRLHGGGQFLYRRQALRQGVESASARAVVLRACARMSQLGRPLKLTKRA